MVSVSFLLLTPPTSPYSLPPPPPVPYSLYSHTHSLTRTLSSSVDVGGQPTPQTWARAFPLQSAPPGTSSRLSLLLTFISLGVFSLQPQDGEGRGGVWRMRQGGREVPSPPPAGLATSPHVRPALVALVQGGCCTASQGPRPPAVHRGMGQRLGSRAGDVAVSLSGWRGEMLEADAGRQPLSRYQGSEGPVLPQALDRPRSHLGH